MWYTPWVLLTSTFFHKKSTIFAISRNTDIDCILKNMVEILMMLTKLATLDLLKIKVFGNKVYDVIFFVHDPNSKVLSCDSIYIVNVAMWAKFSNPSISMRVVIITTTW